MKENEAPASRSPGRTDAAAAGARADAGHRDVPPLDDATPPALRARQAGWERYRLGDLGAATSQFEEALRLDPNDAYAYAGRGMVHAAEERYDAAAADYSRAVELAPDYALGYYYRAEARRAAFELELAIADYTTALELVEKDAFLLGRALARIATEAFDEALADLTAACALNPRNAQAHLVRGQALAFTGRLDDALVDFNAAEKLELLDPELYVGRAMVKLRRGDLAGATHDYRRATEIDADAWAGWAGLATALAADGNATGARQAFGRAETLCPKEERDALAPSRAILAQLLGD